MSYAVDIEPIFDVRCSNGCHGSASNPSGGLFVSYGDMIDQPSNQSNLDHIAPGSPDDSYVWHKLNNTQGSVGGSGGIMPKTGGPLSQSELDLIEAWITTGANP